MARNASRQAEALFSDFGPDCLLLTPNHRAERQMLEAYGQWCIARGTAAVLRTPAIHAVDIWLQRSWAALVAGGQCAPRHLLSPVQELHLWRDVIANSEAGRHFLNPGAAARRAREARSLLRWWHIDSSELAEECARSGAAHDDSAVFLAWLETVEQRCEALALTSLADLLDPVIEALDRGQLAAPRRLILHAFREPPRRYRDLFAALVNAGAELHEPDSETARPPLRKYAAANPAQEAEAAVSWACQQIQARPEARVALICPELGTRHAELEGLLRHALHPASLLSGRAPEQPLYSLSAAPTLDQAPLVAAACALLALNRERLPVLELCQLLRSPFLLAAEEEADARAALEYRLRDRGEESVSVAELLTLCNNADKAWYSPRLAAALRHCAMLRRQARGTRGPAAWLRVLEDQWQALGWPGESPLNSEEGRQLSRFQEVLAEYQRLDFLSQPLDLEQAIDLLQDLLKQSNLPGPRGDAAIQVLQPGEAEGQRFDALWILGLAEQQWPPPAQPNPFLPLALQQRHGLPQSDPGLHGRRATALLDALLRSSRGPAVLSHPCQLDDAEATPCAWLLAQPGELDTLDGGSAAPMLPASLRELSGNAELELQREAAALPLPGTASTEPRGGSRVLEDQAACPFRAFAVHRLGAQALPRPRFGLPPSARGNILHTALELVWERLHDQRRLQSLDAEAEARLVGEAVDQALRRHARDFSQTLQPGLRALEAARLHELLTDWLRVERERGGFRVAALEHKLQWRHARLVLNLRIDRIEALDAGGAALVDYKSGRLQRPDWLDARPDQPQLPLYLLAAEADARWGTVGAVLFAEINVEERRFLGLARDEGICAGQELGRQRGMADLSWDALKQRWRQDLEALAEEFINGRLSVAPKHRSTCRYCHLEALCRIGDPVDEQA